MNIDTYDLVYSNSTAAKLAGYSDEDIAKMRNPMLDVVHPDDMEAMIASIKRMKSVSDDTVVELEYRVIASDGNIRWFRDRCSVFRRDEAGITVEKMGLTHDFTESKAALIALIEAEKMSTTGEMARMIAHEVRNPLTSVNLSVEMLRSKLKDQPGLMSYIDIITRNNKRINQLITELLSATRPIDSAVQRISASQLVDEAADLVNDRVILGQKKLLKIYKSDCHIIVNPESVRIAILNLILNAVEAVPRETGRIEVKLWSEEDLCYISVKDNGPGIAKDKLSYIFDLYHTTKPTGMGLGLASAQTLIINNNGTIHAESQLGEGTRFTVAFPAVY
jgi:PAS domain S-box-containing protein